MMYAFFLGMYSTYSKMQYVFTYYIIIYIKIDHFYSSHGTLQNVKLKTKRLCPQLARLKFTGGTLRYMRLNEYLQGALKAWENGRCLLCFFFLLQMPTIYAYNKSLETIPPKALLKQQIIHEFDTCVITK